MMINLKKKSRTAIEIASLDNNNLFKSSQLRARVRKLPVHDHMTNVVKSDIRTGHEEIDNLDCNLKIIFYCKFIENPCIFSKLVHLIY